MNKIKLMDTNLANKIAAGEVVESIHSVVKELVENSVDAGSSKIKISLIESGLVEIKVVDNGSGMSPEDAKLSVLRHATSKLFNINDLNRITSLGFRGEALPSIASVSKMTIKTSDGNDSVHLEISESKITKESKSELRKGTEVIVRNLFYNTPARLKHLKSSYRELADVTNYVQGMALAHPGIKWELYHDDKSLLITDGNNNQLQVINDIYGVIVTKKMLDIEGNNDDYEISGYVSKPESYKSSRKNITIIVNGRVVKSNEVISSILEAYHTYLPEGKVPIVVLNIKVDQSLIDVNIHPAKLTIKFSKLEELRDLIFNIIRNRINKEILIPSINYSNDSNHKQVNESFSEMIQSSIQFVNQELTKPTQQLLPYMQVKGFVKGTYIIGEDNDNMYLIDQHAMNERINYEYYLEQLSNPNQETVNLLLSYKIELPKNEYLILEKNFYLLDQLQIGYQEFGDNAILINSHPLWLPKDNEIMAIEKIIDVIIDKENQFDLAKFNDNIAKMVSCKASIKANENISIEEAQDLIGKLRITKYPYTCPHGRPVIISFSNYELEKMFKRAM